jgi:hypothetical protein
MQGLLIDVMGGQLATGALQEQEWWACLYIGGCFAPGCFCDEFVYSLGSSQLEELSP